MGPQKVLVPVPFAGGLDTKTDPAQVVPGKLLSLQNGIFRNTGAVGRRWGYSALGKGIIGGGTATIASAKAIQPFKNELLLYDGLQAYSYIQADDAWSAKGEIVSVIQTNRQVIAGSSQQISPDFASLDGIELYAWEDSRGGIYYSVIDAAGGAILFNDTPAITLLKSNARAPKVIPFAAAGKLVILFDDSHGNVVFATIDPRRPTVAPVATTVISGASGSGHSPLYFDACLSPDGQTLHVAASAIPAGNVIGTFQPILYAALDATLNPKSGFATNSIGFPWQGSSIPTLVSLTPDPNRGRMLLSATDQQTSPNALIFTYAYDQNTGGAFSLATITLTASTVPFQSVASVVVGDTLSIFAETPASSSPPLNSPIYQRLWTATFGLASLVAGASSVLISTVGLASKPFVYLGKIYLNVAYESNLQSTYFTIDASNAQVIGKVNAGLGGGLLAANDFMLPECQQVSTGVFKFANLIKSAPNTEAGQVVALLGVNSTELDFFDSNAFLSSDINGSLYTVGGVLQAYDGAQYVELGFNVYPETITTTQSSGGAQAPGVYEYAVTYEWVDNNDRTDISTPSPVFSVNNAGSQKVTLTIPTLKLTRKDRVRIVIYRSQVGGAGILYRITSAILPLYNDPTVDTVSFDDVLADGSITGNGAMYTQPLVLGSNPVVPNSAPPACSLIATYANRLFIAGLDDPYTIWYSQPSLQNSPMQFSADLTMRTDPDGGPITAIQRLDDKLIIFKSNAIFYLTGQGPTPTGDDNDFGSPIAIPSGQIGCISPNSMVETPVGILFQSLNGIYLLDRGLNVSYKGAPVEAYNSLTITSATLVPNQWVVFTTTDGTSIVYDYFYDQWSTFSNHDGVDSGLFLGDGDLFVYAKADGTVFKQTPTTFTDAGAPIPFSLTTAWFSPAMLGGGLQGFQRVYHAFLLGTYKGSHTLNFGCAFDYDPTVVAMTAIPVDSTLGIGIFGNASPFGSDPVFGGAVHPVVYQFRVDILRKCQSMQITISDTQQAPGDEGFALSALSLMVGVKVGGNKMPAIKQFGAV